MNPSDGIEHTTEEFALREGRPERLTTLETSWTQLKAAHQPGPAGQAAMHELISRYHDAVERYLRLKLRDRNLADEVLQEFWTKLLQGKLAGADQTKGRFRDYLRTVLHRLIVDHFRGHKAQNLPPGDLLDPTVPDAEYDRAWRTVILDRVFARLDTYEAATPKNRYASILRLRHDNPDASIDELAERLSTQLNQKVRPDAFRKTLQRARLKFFELLKQELRETIHPATTEDIEDEINELGLGYLYRRYEAEEEG
jgi:RNA polymerase sigma-70 factor (ECF subfamily)